MDHDKKTGLMHFSGDELGALNEPRSPIDERAAPYMLRNAQLASESAVDQLQQLHAGQSHNRGKNSADIPVLRARIALLDQVKIELATVASEVELRHMLRG